MASKLDTLYPTQNSDDKPDLPSQAVANHVAAQKELEDAAQIKDPAENRKATLAAKKKLDDNRKKNPGQKKAFDEVEKGNYD